MLNASCVPGPTWGSRLSHLTLSTALSRTSLVAQMVKNQPTAWETWILSLGQEDPLEK